MPDNEEAKRLSRLLTLAAEKLANKGPIFSAPEGGANLAKIVRECRTAIDQGTLTQDQKQELLCIFAPTCIWDDSGGDADTANEIFSLLEKLYFTT